jgi:hypothetical protein
LRIPNTGDDPLAFQGELQDFLAGCGGGGSQGAGGCATACGAGPSDQQNSDGCYAPYCEGSCAGSSPCTNGFASPLPDQRTGFTKDGYPYVGAAYPDVLSNYLGSGFVDPERIPRNIEKSLCSVNQDPTEHLKPGDAFEGGIFLGIIGEPNDNGSIIATGENPYCLLYGYQSNNRCQACPLQSRRSTERFVIHAGVNERGKNFGPCYCDSVMPFSYIPEDLISKPDSFPRLPHTPYLYNLHETPIKRETAKSGSYEHIQRYYDIAERYYGQRTITRKWALIVAPEDLSFNDKYDLSWGLRQSAYNAESDDPTEEGIYMGSPFLDGLIGTRMFDDSSQTWLPWFIEDENAQDPHAYLRWVHKNENFWDIDVDQTKLTSDQDYFKEQYEILWENDNKENSIMRLVSEWNSTGKYDYQDWYIPSIIEMMYIYGNRNMLNAALLRDGHEPLAQDKYWSSTTGARYRANAPSNCNPNNTFRAVDGSDNVLDDSNARQAPHAHRAFYQDFTTGFIESQLRVEDFASARPVRRIPLFETTHECEETNHLARYISVDNGDCYNCRTCNCPELN